MISSGSSVPGICMHRLYAQHALAKMLVTLASEKNSAGEVTLR
jgi:hypothetical protein